MYTVVYEIQHISSTTDDMCLLQVKGIEFTFVQQKNLNTFLIWIVGTLYMLVLLFEDY